MLAVFNGPPIYQSLDVARSCDDEIPGAALYRTFCSPVLSKWKLLQYRARVVEVKGKLDSSLFKENYTDMRKCAIIVEYKSTHNLLLSVDSTTSLSTTTTRQAKRQEGRALLEKWPGESCVPSDGANSWVHGDDRADRRYGVYYRVIVKPPFFALWETIMFEWRLAAVGQIWKVQTICVRDLSIGEE